MVLTDEHEVAAGGEGVAGGCGEGQGVPPCWLGLGKGAGRSGGLEVVPITACLAAGLFGGGKRPLFEQAGKGKKWVAGEAGQKGGFVGLLDD